MPQIAVYTIALNEEKFVDTWFKSVQEADYWLVADTGSTDNTVSKLRDLGVKCEVIHVRPWRFDMARNVALSLIPVNMDICISMDMDEHMQPGWRQALETAWQPGTTRVRHTYHTHYANSAQPSLSHMADKIHARLGYTWKRPVHESVFAWDTEHVVTVPELVQKHMPDAQKGRSQYLPLLQLSHEENPTCAQTLFWLAREHAHMGENDQASTHFLKLLHMDHVWHLERAESERWLAKLQPHRALEWLRRSVATAPERREGWRDLAQYYYGHAQWPSCYAACVEALNIQSGTGSYLDTSDVWGAHLYDLAAVSAWNLGLREQSEAYATQAVQLSPQDERLQNNLKVIQQTLGKS
jgi:glycosyltransferase involved in cell wall biosynthesis